MSTKTLALAAASIFVLTGPSLSAEEGWFAKTGAIHFSGSADGYSIDLTGVYLGAGYEIELAENFFLAPEIRVATGVGSDDLLGVDVDLDTAFFAGAKGIFRAENGFYAFGSVGYGDITIDASYGSIEESASADDIGFGVGFGYEFTDKIGMEISFEDYDGTDVIQLGTNFRF
jgi:hypothetical protein